MMPDEKVLTGHYTLEAGIAARHARAASMTRNVRERDLLLARAETCAQTIRTTTET